MAPPHIGRCVSGFLGPGWGPQGSGSPISGLPGRRMRGAERGTWGRHTDSRSPHREQSSPPAGQSRTRRWCSEEIPPLCQSLYPETRRSVTQGPYYLKKGGEPSPLTYQIATNNSQTYFFKLPEVAMVTCMRSSQASCSKWGCLEPALHPPCGAPACAGRRRGEPGAADVSRDRRRDALVRASEGLQTGLVSPAEIITVGRADHRTSVRGVRVRACECMCMSVCVQVCE